MSSVERSSEREILPIAYKLLGKKEPRHVSAIFLPYGRGTLANAAVRF
jgi:hypothetical protein